MTLNREVFFSDPTDTTIPNDGVAKVGVPETAEQWEVLRYELQSFVCEGEYERGLDRILSTFLSNLGKPTQPAVWVNPLRRRCAWTPRGSTESVPAKPTSSPNLP